MANRNFPNSRMYTGHVMPVLLDCNFVVTPSNGLGITNLKGPFVQNVFMHTTTTPTAGNSSPKTPNVVVTNPNPASGTVVVQLNDNYSRLFTGGMQAVAPAGTAVSVNATNLTIGNPYIITSLGNATAADWIALGVPAGVTPALTGSFIAAATGTGTSNALVAPPAATGSQVTSIEVVGDANVSISPNQSASQGFGSQLILQFRNVSGSVTAPATGSTISLSFLLSNSSVIITGE